METRSRARLHLWQNQPRETEFKTGSREEPCPEARAASLGAATDDRCLLGTQERTCPRGAGLSLTVV